MKPAPITWGSEHVRTAAEHWRAACGETRAFVPPKLLIYSSIPSAGDQVLWGKAGTGSLRHQFSSMVICFPSDVIGLQTLLQTGKPKAVRLLPRHSIVTFASGYRSAFSGSAALLIFRSLFTLPK